MAKVALGARTLLLPLPSVLVGADVDGKPKFFSLCLCGIVKQPAPDALGFFPPAATYVERR